VSIVAAASISMTASPPAAADSAAPVAVSNQSATEPAVQPLVQPVAPAANPTAAQPTANAPDAQANAGPPDIGGPVILGEGFVYQGGLRDGKPDGKGVKRWPTGEWVVGNFAQGKLEGEATIHNSDGGTLSGVFKNNAPWEAVEKTEDGRVITQYSGGVMRQVTQPTPAMQATAQATPQAAAPAAAAPGAQPVAAQQVHSSADVPKQ
jgi:hypothetical protein